MLVFTRIIWVLWQVISPLSGMTVISLRQTTSLLICLLLSHAHMLFGRFETKRTEVTMRAFQSKFDSHTWVWLAEALAWTGIFTVFRRICYGRNYESIAESMGKSQTAQGTWFSEHKCIHSGGWEGGGGKWLPQQTVARSRYTSSCFMLVSPNGVASHRDSFCCSIFG